jgi:hypothetical protein
MFHFAENRSICFEMAEIARGGAMAAIRASPRNDA